MRLSRISLALTALRKAAGTGPSPSGFTALSSTGTSYSVTRVVLDSAGASYTVPAAVLSSSGTSYTPI